MKYKTKSPYLIIGSGIAGLSLALRLAEHHEVTIITKKRDVDSNTNYAQGGIASVLSQEDSLAAHYEDTLKAGDGLCDQKAVKLLVDYGPTAVKALMDWGVAFTKAPKEQHQFGLA